MKVYTKTVIDIESGEIIAQEWFDYDGPVARCDRSLQNQAAQAEKSAAQTAGNYGAAARNTGGFLSSQLQRFAVNPPGYSPVDEANMQAMALQGGAARSNAANEAARLRAARTGNPAALPAIEAANTEASARGTGGMLQTILANNAALKSRQQQSALGELGKVYGTDVSGQLESERIAPEDINAGTEAGRSGWLQNVTGVLAALNRAGK